jgi:NitT/TauT family transport system permease protein
MTRVVALPARASRPRRRRAYRISPSLLWGAIGLAVALAAWWLITAIELVPASGLPDPAAVAAATRRLLADPDFRFAFWDTIWTWAKALLLATLVAVAIGLSVGWIPWLARAFSVPMHVGRSVPATTLIPIAIVLFGLGAKMKLAVVAYSMAWIVLMNTVYGVRNLDRQTVVSALAMRFRRRDRVLKMLIPSALPSIMTGVRVAAGVGFVVTLSAELLGATTGVGTVLLLYQNSEQPDYVYAGVLLVSLAGMFLNYAIGWVERLVVPWVPSNRERRG